MNEAAVQPPPLTDGAAIGASEISEYHLSEFLAQETMIEIIPKFSMDRIEGIGGTYGPFSPNYPVVVPLWLALYIRQTNTCTVTLPPYLTIPELERVFQMELEQDAFQPLPFYFFEIAMQLTTYASQDIPQFVEVQRLVAGIAAARWGKIRKNYQILSSNMRIPCLLVSNFAAVEVAELRCSMARVMDDALQLDARGAPVGGVAAPERRRPREHVAPSAVHDTTATIADTTTSERVSLQVESQVATTTDITTTEVTPPPNLRRRRTLRQR